MATAARTDADSIAAMLRGDERAFQEFFVEYFPRLYRFARVRVRGDCEDAKEIAQATLVKAMRHLSQYRGEAALFTWLCSICRREISDYLDARRREAGRLVYADDSKELRAALDAAPARSGDEPAHGYDVDETRRLIRETMDKLPLRYGDLLELKYVEGRSLEEIAKELAIGETAAQSRLARARVAFREALERACGTDADDVMSAMAESLRESA